MKNKYTATPPARSLRTSPRAASAPRTREIHRMPSKEEKSDSSVSVRPGVEILGILKHLNYKPWYALAEFVDNSVQSYLANRAAIEKIEGSGFQLKVEIEIEDGDRPRIVVRDNAAGISKSDYQRAFRPAETPPDNQGLSEFGMGMKSAACWFSPRWLVRTKALGEDAEGLFSMNVEEIVSTGEETVSIRRTPAPSAQHFTEIILNDLHRVPRRRGLGKIREYLADIYRVFLRSGVLQLVVNDETVVYEDPEILFAPRVGSEPDAPSLEWRKELDFEVSGVRVRGFAALRKEGSTSRAGFALMRRDRLIQGGSDEGWKPERIFGRANSFRSQRVFGELYLDGLAVSHTKDGFQLEEYEEEIIERLHEELDAEPLPLLMQAERMRVRAKAPNTRLAADSAARSTATVLDARGGEVLPGVIDKGRSDAEAAAADPEDTGRIGPSVTDAIGSSDSSRPIVARSECRTVRVDGEDWRIVIELTNDPAVSEWIRVGESMDLLSREITLKFSLAHPFMERFATSDASELEPLLRVACAMGLAQVLARKAGVGKAGVVLMNLNDLMREVFAHD